MVIPCRLTNKKIVLRLYADSVLLNTDKDCNQISISNLLKEGCKLSNITGKNIQVRGFAVSIDKISLSPINSNSDCNTSSSSASQLNSIDSIDFSNPYFQSCQKNVSNLINPCFFKLSCYLDATTLTNERSVLLNAIALLDNFEITPTVDSLIIIKEIQDIFGYFKFIIRRDPYIRPSFFR